MNMMFNAVEFIHRLEGEGLSRGAAEAISEAIEDRNRTLATKADLTDLATKADVSHGLELSRVGLQADLAKALQRQTIQFGTMFAAGMALAVTAVGLIIGLK